VTNSNSNRPEIEPLTRTQILAVMGVTALILLIIAKIWQKFGSIAIISSEITPTAILTGIAISAIIIIASAIIYQLWPGYRQSAQLYLELIIKPLVVPDLIWLALLPGLSEELLFRGVMLPAFGYDFLAIIISSALFGILHLSGAQQWPYAVWATIIGLILGYSAYITDNLIVPIVAHIMTNFVSSILWKKGNSIGFPTS
jgi:membrane protease YdiL (CAAX protease family)